MQACGQPGLPEQEDCVAEDELEEITAPQAAPGPEEVFARLLKSPKFWWLCFLPDLK